MGKRKTLNYYSDDEGKSTKKKSLKKYNERKSTKELEEGEVTDSESSDLGQEEFDDGYDSDLMGDAEDRFRLAQMTEKEREQEIFRRVEARETMRTRFNIEKKLKKEQRRELKKQRSLLNELNEFSSSSNIRERIPEKKKHEDTYRKSSKKYSSNDTTKACPEETREPDEKENKSKDEQNVITKTDSTLEDNCIGSNLFKTKLKASDVYSDDSDSSTDEEIVRKKRQKKKKPVSSSSSSSSSSESDIEAKPRSSAAHKVEYVSTKAQLNQMKLSRHKLERFVDLFFFKRFVVGCFVKLLIAMKENRAVYRICEIMDVNEADEIYQLGSIQTNKTLRLRHGAKEQNFRLAYVSNGEFSDADFIRWQDTCTLHGVAMPTVEQMESKVKDIKEAILYKLSFEEVEKMVSDKERFRNATYEFALKKTQLMKEYESARDAEDVTRAGELKDELNELEERAVKLNQFRTSTISSFKYINDRNRRICVKNEEKEELISTADEKMDDSLVKRQIKSKKPTGDDDDSYKSPDVARAASTSPLSNEWADRDNESPLRKMNQSKQNYGSSSRSFLLS